MGFGFQGTRAVADLVEFLGVRFVTNDRYAMDLHGNFTGGWPGLVQKVY